MDADGTGLEHITQEPGDEYAPAWSPDRGRIVFGFDDGGEPHWHSGLASVNPDGSGWTELLVRDRERVEGPEWSPDGDRIAFTIFEDRGPTPYVLDPDQLDLVRLRDEPGVVLSWTPDGQRILIAADQSLVTVRPDGSGERVFLANPPEDGVLTVDWSPDGRWIVLSPPTGRVGLMYLMRADGSQIFRIGPGSEASWRPEPG
jgi:TolB protein